MRLENLSALCGARRHIKTGKSILQGRLSKFLAFKKGHKKAAKKNHGKKEEKNFTGGKRKCGKCRP